MNINISNSNANIWKNNAIFFLDMGKKNGYSQRFLAKRFDLGIGTLTDYRKGIVPKREKNFEKFAKLCSFVLNIPYDLFENGQALLKKDFSKIIEERNLQKDKTPSSTDIKGSGRVDDILAIAPISTSEIIFILSLRNISGSVYDEVPEISLKHLRSIYKMVEGDVNVLASIKNIVEYRERRQNDKGEINER